MEKKRREEPVTSKRAALAKKMSSNKVRYQKFGNNNDNRKDIRTIVRKKERQTGQEVRKKRRELRDGVYPTIPPAQNDAYQTQE